MTVYIGIDLKAVLIFFKTGNLHIAFKANIMKTYKPLFNECPFVLMDDSCASTLMPASSMSPAVGALRH